MPKKTPTELKAKVMKVEAPAKSHRHAADWIILSIACLAQFMVVLDVSIVNVALPSMQRDLHFTIENAQWVVNAYVLTFAGFLLLGGRAADIFGRRRVYLFGLGVFTVASIGAGFAASSTQIVAVRALQGIGGAILSPATLTIIVTTFHGKRLPRALGAWSAVAGAGGAVGGLLGGILTGWVSWRWVFFINVPLGIVAGVLALVYLREMRSRDSMIKLDVTGAVVVTGSLGALVYGVVNTTSTSWTSTSTLLWFLVAAIGLSVFFAWETKVASHPLVPLRMFRVRSLSMANLVMMLIGGAFFAMWYFLTFFFQYILGYGAVKTGFAFLPMALGIIVGAQVSSRLLPRLHARPLLIIGTIIGALGFVWLSRIDTHSSYLGVVLVPSVACALAMGLLFTPLASAATTGVDRADAGLASGVLNTSRQLGGSLGLAILGTLAADAAARYADPTSALALVSGYRVAFLVSAGITVAALLASLAVPRVITPHPNH